MEDLFYKITAFALMAVFYGCLTVKSMIQRKKGIVTDQMGKGKKGTAQIIEIILEIAAFIVPLCEILSIVIQTNMPPFFIRIIGIVIGVIGDVIFVISVATMRDSWRSGVPENDRTELITDGIYRFSRNPAFVGFDMVYIGILLMYFNPFLLAATLFAVVMFHLQIVLVEEEFLTRIFGEDYKNYMKHVNRYLGRR